jgi:hypothetical protein
MRAQAQPPLNHERTHTGNGHAVDDHEIPRGGPLTIT